MNWSLECPKQNFDLAKMELELAPNSESEIDLPNLEFQTCESGVGV